MLRNFVNAQVYRRIVLRYTLAVVCVVVALVIKLMLSPLVLIESPYLVFFAAVMISAWYGGLGPGILATFLAAVLSAIFFIAPQLSLEVAGEVSQVELAIFVLEGLVISGFSGALRSARRQAESALRDRDHFLAVAAHELKTPLTSLIAYAHVLQNRLAPGSTITERDRRAIVVLDEQSRRLHTLIESLLDLSRINTGRLSIDRRPLDIAGLARRVVEEIQPTLEQHTVQYSGVSEPLIVEGDELRLEQVFQNLLQNAIKYSPYGGRIVVRVEEQDRWAVITVSDQGIGIPETARARVFERYFRAEPSDEEPVRGMGIGLYVVQEIVTLHGGTVELVSTEATGSTFLVRLPPFIRTAAPEIPVRGEPDPQSQRVEPIVVGGVEHRRTEPEGNGSDRL